MTSILGKFSGNMEEKWLQKRSSNRREVDSHVLIFIHKEKMLAKIESLYPADHYVMVDDKLRILSEMKSIWKDRLTSVFVRQGHYANDPAITARYPRPDLAIERIADLVDLSPVKFGGTVKQGEPNDIR